MRVTLTIFARWLGVPEPCLSPAAVRGQKADWTNWEATGAQVDSRLIQPGDIFFCLSGEKADGHDFALAAAQAGAAAIVAERNPFSGREGAEDHPPVFLVPQVKRALAQAARAYRDTVSARVVCITGTAGKTSVKEVLATVLAQAGTVSKNALNLNNQIGLPLSLLQADAEARFWVMEAGISEPQDMDELGEIVHPDVAVVLNAGEGHVQGLGEKGVAFHKSALLRYVASGGVGLVSADYPDLVMYAEQAAALRPGTDLQLCFFSAIQSKGDYWASFTGEADLAQGIFTVGEQGEERQVRAPFIGPYGAENVAAVYAAARSMELSDALIARGLERSSLPEQRFSCSEHGGFFLIDDSYNANPLSAGRMLETATQVANRKNIPLILVMGEMGELGSVSEQAHVTLGKQMAASGTQLIFWKGEQRGPVREGLRQGGYAGDFYPVGGGQEFAGLVEELALTHGVILFKGSRSNRLEWLVGVFRQIQETE